MQGEGRTARSQDQAGHGQGSTGGPEHAQTQSDRRTAHPGELDGGRLDGIRGADRAGVGHQDGQEGAQACAERRGGEADAGGERDEQRQRCARGEQRHCHEQSRGRDRAAEQDGGLATAVDEAAKEWAAEAQGGGIRARHQAGGAERAGHVLGVDDQGDAEHRQRKPGEDRDREQMKRTGRGGER